MNKYSAPLLILCCLVQACTAVNKNDIDTATQASDIDQARALIGSDWPLDANTRLTTSGDIYLENLDSQINALEHLVTRRPDDRLWAKLALNYYHRFQILGRLSDAEQARQILLTAFEREHTSSIDLAYTQVLIGFHEFELAQDSLESARKHGANQGTVLELQEALKRATTAARDTVPSELPLLDGKASSVELVTRAAELLERGQAENASRLLKAAQDQYQDTAPYLLAWIQVQQGIVFLRYKDYPSALTFFAAAHARFPQYALATEHLAETQLALGNFHQAAELYREVSAQTDNPEFYYRLAAAERALGMEQAARQHEQQAHSGYVQLIARYPSMYADHAARYFIASGDPETALELAKQNMALRSDIRARTLWLEANLVAGRAGIAHSELEAIRALDYAPPELPELEAQLRTLAKL